MRCIILSEMEEAIWQQLKTVMDPELDVDIVSLGLIYEVEVSEKRVKIVMTLTTPGCPLAPVIDRMIKEAVGQIVGVEEDQTEIELVWDPPWTSEMMSEEVKLQLGFI